MPSLGCVRARLSASATAAVPSAGSEAVSAATHVRTRSITSVAPSGGPRFIRSGAVGRHPPAGHPPPRPPPPPPPRGPPVGAPRPPLTHTPTTPSPAPPA